MKSTSYTEQFRQACFKADYRKRGWGRLVLKLTIKKEKAHGDGRFTVLF